MCHRNPSTMIMLLFSHHCRALALQKSAKLGLAANEKSFLIFRLIFACVAFPSKTLALVVVELILIQF